MREDTMDVHERILEGCRAAMPAIFDGTDQPALGWALDDPATAVARIRKRMGDDVDLPIVPTMRDVLVAVSLVTGVNSRLLLGPRRARWAARPRQLAMHIMAEKCPGKSMAQIGRFMGRDHTTIIYGCQVIARLLAIDPELAQLRARIVDALKYG